MAKFWNHITDEQAALIRSAPLFFVASADPVLKDGDSGEGPVNVSPKGAAPLHLVIEVDVERTMTSCGYGVPVMERVRERQRSDRGMKFKPKR